MVSFSHSSDHDSTLDCTPSDPVYNDDNTWYTVDICDGLYAYGGNSYLSMFLVTDTGVIFIDAPPALGDKLADIVSSITSNPITSVIYSHHHADHIGAAASLPNIDTADIYCLDKTQDQIEVRPDFGIPHCTKIIRSNRVFGSRPYKVKGMMTFVLFDYI